MVASGLSAGVHADSMLQAIIRRSKLFDAPTSERINITAGISTKRKGSMAWNCAIMTLSM
jgi:hypothetical protein